MTNITLEPLSLFCQSTAMQYELNYSGSNKRLVSNVVEHSMWWLSSPSPLNFSSVEIGVGASWWRSSKRAGSLDPGGEYGAEIFLGLTEKTLSFIFAVYDLSLRSAPAKVFPENLSETKECLRFGLLSHSMINH